MWELIISKILICNLTVRGKYKNNDQKVFSGVKMSSPEIKVPHIGK